MDETAKLLAGRIREYVRRCEQIIGQPEAGRQIRLMAVDMAYDLRRAGKIDTPEEFLIACGLRAF